MKIFVKYHLPPILYGILILAVSSIPNLKAPEAANWPLDKPAHLIEYAGFAILIYRSGIRWPIALSPQAVAWLTFTLAAAWGLLDEYWQSRIPGRFSDWRDFLVDITGAALVVGIIWVRRNRRMAKQAR